MLALDDAPVGLTIPYAFGCATALFDEVMGIAEVPGDGGDPVSGG